MSLSHLKENELVQLYQLQQGQERWDDWCRLIDHVRYSEASLSETREALAAAERDVQYWANRFRTHTDNEKKLLAAEAALAQAEERIQGLQTMLDVRTIEVSNLEKETDATEERERVLREYLSHKMDCDECIPTVSGKRPDCHLRAGRTRREGDETDMSNTDDDPRSFGCCLKHGDYDGRELRCPQCVPRRQAAMIAAFAAHQSAAKDEEIARLKDDRNTYDAAHKREAANVLKLEAQLLRVERETVERCAKVADHFRANNPYSIGAEISNAIRALTSGNEPLASAEGKEPFMFICAVWKKLSDGVARCDLPSGHEGNHVDSVILISWDVAPAEGKEDCLCVHATPNFDGTNHDRRCGLATPEPEAGLFIAGSTLRELRKRIDALESKMNDILPDVR